MGGNGTGFASWFLGILRDRNHCLSEGCLRFTSLMRGYSWARIRTVMPRGLHTKGAFDRPEAGRFYDSFRKAVVSRIDRDWREFSKGRVVV